MSKSLLTVLCALLLCTRSALSLWDFAVTAKTKILFYDSQWREITSSAHQFDQLSALTFDETEEIVYFNDQLHNNGSIFSLKIPTAHEDPHILEKIVHRTQNESITSIAYDPLNRNLFWADKHNRKIYFVSIDESGAADADQDDHSITAPKVLIDFAEEESVPDGIAVDICRRKLYWTNSNFKNATVERIDLDGSTREVIVRSDLFLPHGIVVDQLSDRIYWVVDQQGVHFSVESANLDGSDRQVIVKGLNNIPFNLAVTKDSIFWTDLTHNAVWSHPKFVASASNASNAAEETSATSDQPLKVLSFVEQQPRGIVYRTRFLTNLENDQHCSDVVKKIKHRLLQPRPTRNPTETQMEKLRREYCLNGGSYNAQSGMCICQIGFDGARCETNECHNFCVHGTCSMSSSGFAQCTCQHGFYGERCQSYKCSRFCFNEGHCKIEPNGEPACECKDNFGGQRCEQNSTEICSLFCRVLKHEPETYVPFGCHDICEELAQDEGADMYAIPKYQHLEVCQSSGVSMEIIVLVCGVVASLCLVLLIVHGLRRFYKPARPRIKKTFVVRKRAATSPDTPLTNRPIATEQCEITIENCCNMNICDTPCFDPQLVQQTLSRENNTKEDKKMLIHNMEDDLY